MDAPPTPIVVDLDELIEQLAQAIRDIGGTVR
jgi:hypothetical protein